MHAVRIAEALPRRRDHSDDEIRGLIRRKLFEGILCEDIAHLVYGEISAGSTCAACDLPIAAGSTAIDTHGKDRVKRCYHPTCHLLLSIELDGLAQR